MIKFYTLLTFSLFITSLNAQYCSGGGPTSLIDSNVESVSLTGDGSSISFVGCPGVLGVQDLTALTADLTAGNSYSITIQFGTCGGNYSGAGEVWIDYNNNQVFEPSESIGQWVGTPPVAASTFNFTVPNGIPNANSRMRIIQREGNSFPPLDPCGTFSWGSVMDFGIGIGGGIDCSPYIGNDTSDPRIVTSIPFTENHDNSFCYSNDNNAYISPDVFYLLLPQAGVVSVQASLCGSTFDTFLSVFDTDGNTLAFNDDGSCGAQSDVEFSVVGIDSVYIIVEGWGTESGAYTINITEGTVGVEDHEIVSYDIYPNPLEIGQELSFKINDLKAKTLVISDIRGKQIKVLSNYNSDQIVVNDLSKGIYFVTFTTNNIKYTKKLIIK